MDINKPTRQSARIMDIDLFQKLSNTRQIMIAGFKAWLLQRGDKLHHSMKEWKALYSEYQNR